MRNIDKFENKFVKALYIKNGGLTLVYYFRFKRLKVTFTVV